MKTAVVYMTGSDFALSGDPVVVSLCPNKYSDGSTFRQVIVDVECNLLGSSTMVTKTFALPGVDEWTFVECDISSALRSVLYKWEYDASIVESGNSVIYPCLEFCIKAHRREFTSYGTVKDYNSVKIPKESDRKYVAYLGRVGEYARWKGFSFGKIFTNKPAGEIFSSEQIVCKTSLADNVIKTTFSTSSGNDSRERKVFLFVNSYGVFETISVLTRESMGYEISSTRHSLSHSPSYTPKPNISTYKQGGGAVWQMSSGHVNRDWADWFASEFLMARHYWMRHDGKWLPVVVEPDGDTVVVADNNDPSLMAVSFTVRSAVSGSVR